MDSLRTVTERSLLAHDSPEFAPIHTQRIHAAPSPIKRAGLIAIDAFVQTRPELARQLLGAQPLPAHFTFVGCGYHSLVFRTDESTVLKIDERQRDKPVEVQQEIAATMQADHELLADYIGEPILPHDTSVAEHPWLGPQHAIQIAQPYCELEYLQLWVNRPEGETRADLEERVAIVLQQYPELAASLGEVIESNRALHTDTGLCLDIVGQNIGVEASTRKLRVVDSQPVTRQYPEVQRAILEHLDVLGETLQQIAA